MTYNLKLPLFLTRLSIFYFLLPWQLMRFSAPEQIVKISKTYYKFDMPEALPLLTGVLMMALLIAFLIGFKKRVTYLVVFILHAVGTVMTLPQIVMGLEGFKILFLAAIPTAAAMWLLWVLRKEDTLLSLKGKLG